MRLPNLEYGREWAIMELLCLGLTLPKQRELFEQLIQSEKLDWGELLEQALRHRIISQLAYYVLEVPAVVPIRIVEHLRMVILQNRYRRVTWYGEAMRVVKALEQKGVRVAARKGAAYESALYRGNGSRRLGDIDLLIAPKDGEQVMDILPMLGYQLGYFDERRNELVSLKRKDLVKYRLNPDHLPPYSLLTSDSLVPVLELDVATSFTWAKGPYQVPLNDALAGVTYQPIVGLSDISMPVLDPLYQFLDTTLHLFKEAWFEDWQRLEQDVDLMKFGDIVRLWEAYRGKFLQNGVLSHQLSEAKIVEPVVWVLEHLDRSLGTSIVPELGLQDHVNEAWLKTAYGPSKKLRTWKGTMRERLQNKHRNELFEETE